MRWPCCDRCVRVGVSLWQGAPGAAVHSQSVVAPHLRSMSMAMADGGPYSVHISLGSPGDRVNSSVTQEGATTVLGAGKSPSGGRSARSCVLLASYTLGLTMVPR